MNYDPVDSRIYLLENELNRLAGTMVGGMPTLGKASAALWWLGHREFPWAKDNLLSPNQATGGSALATSEGFLPLDGQDLEIVEGDALIGNQVLQITASAAKARAMMPPGKIKSAVAFEGPSAENVPILPWYIYTASVYARLAEEITTPSRVNYMYLVWYDENDDEISMTTSEFHVTKLEWSLSWVTGTAPQNAASVRIIIEWEQAPGEVFLLDKANLYNGHSPQAWAYPGHGSENLVAGLQAHLNMKAGIFNSDDFLTVQDVCNRLARTRDAESALALSRIPTPNPNVKEH
jgi:hypothetical protein